VIFKDTAKMPLPNLIHGMDGVICLSMPHPSSDLHDIKPSTGSLMWAQL